MRVGCSDTGRSLSLGSRRPRTSGRPSVGRSRTRCPSSRSRREGPPRWGRTTLLRSRHSRLRPRRNRAGEKRSAPGRCKGRGSTRTSDDYHVPPTPPGGLAQCSVGSTRSRCGRRVPVGVDQLVGPLNAYRGAELCLDRRGRRAETARQSGCGCRNPRRLWPGTPLAASVASAGASRSRSSRCSLHRAGGSSAVRGMAGGMGRAVTNFRMVAQRRTTPGGPSARAVELPTPSPVVRTTAPVALIRKKALLESGGIVLVPEAVSVMRYPVSAVIPERTLGRVPTCEATDRRQNQSRVLGPES